MLVSYKWLQTYFKDPLPTPEHIGDIFTMGVFEIESIDQKNGDTVLDIKTLADRNPYALSHRYMAQELGILLKVPASFPTFEETVPAKVSRNLSVTISDPGFCHRYTGRIVEGVSNGPSQLWLKERLETLGQRSINTIVDLTNFVMLDTGQPLHAFDADKVEGNIQVRRAKEKEEITLLDGSVVKLSPEMFVIADDKDALAIAGVKGGKKAEVTSETKNLILEAATFNGTAVRRTAQAVNIRNDSTKRFENQITPERTLLAMKELCALIKQENPAAFFGATVDEYPDPTSQRSMQVNVDDINSRLGIVIPTDEIIAILKRCDVIVEEKSGVLHLTIPLYRSDLIISEDIIEEVGRVYGYDKIPGILPPPIQKRFINKNFYYHNLIRKTLLESGFSEVLTYTLQDKGDVSLLNPLNIHRGHMRDNLTGALTEKIEHNLRYVDLLGLSEVKLFEIGKIFGGKKERYSLAFGLAYPKPPKGFDVTKELQTISEQLSTALACAPFSSKIKIQGNVVELELDEIVDSLPQPTEDVEFSTIENVKYKPYSAYPFATRDIAVFMPGDQREEAQQAVLNIIKNEAGDLLVRDTLFDVFTKTFKNEDGTPGEMKTSYAYRLVFQAQDRTLNEDDLNSIMERITSKMNANDGWQVR